MSRFIRRGKTKVFWVNTLVPGAPTATAVNAGTEITPDIAEMNGFTFASDPVDVPDMDNTFTSKIPGGDTVENSNIVFYEDDANTDIHDAMPKGDKGYVVIFPKGIAGATPAAADECDIWPAEVGSNSRQYTAANEAAKYNVVFTPNAVPVQDAALT